MTTTKKNKEYSVRKPAKLRMTQELEGGKDLDEIRNQDENLELPQKEKPKSKGRPKSTKYLPFVEAREFVIGEMIPSRMKYQEWWDRNKPKTIPRFPYRVYTTEWVSWNDFLGTNNEFGLNVGKKWRPFDEAVSYVHTLKITSYQKWLEYCKTKQLPSDIPARPDLTYAGWRTWNYWLGNRPVETIEAAKVALKNQIYYIIHEQGVPENVLTYGVDSLGQTSFKERFDREKFTIIKTFWYDPKDQAEVNRIVEHFSRPYMDSTNQRITSNVWEIVWWLSTKLEIITQLRKGV